MGTYTQMAVLFFVLLAVGACGWGTHQLWSGKGVPGEQGRDTRRRGGVLLTGGVLCLLVALYVLYQASWLMAGAIVAGMGAGVYVSGTDMLHNSNSR